ncbi:MULTISPECIES: hypothetical protein [Streptomyces]|uniref:hypothetical protein n=1 Tax=Streptomyces TaxID=1883 RepID=UPI00167ED4C9|nr:hypothetical protein [Streptomyces longisporoflavus]GGV69838.1 hypothetical protein GCM10010277_80260 [Streptomyces longisporoflavus]
MPKISVDLTDDELQRLNAYAASKGVSTRSLARTVLISEVDREAFLTAARGAYSVAKAAVADAPEGLR